MARYEISKRHFFVNPYNFVPADLDKTERADATQKSGELLTGYLDCHLKCKTHLAIPDVMNRDPKEKKEKQHYKYPFMGMQQGEPRIPGSSLRGVVRNIYETITDSCFGTMQKDTIVTVRSKQSFQPGLLMKVNGEWKLYHATRHLVVVDYNYHQNKHLEDRGIRLYASNSLMPQSGNKVYYELVYDNKGKARANRAFVKFISNTPTDRSREGYLCIGERAVNRKFQSVFEKGQIETAYSKIKSYDLKKLESVLSVYRDKSINKNYPEKHKGYFSYEKMKENGAIPVYYCLQDGNLDMSFAALGRKAFENTLDGMLFEKSHQKCSGRQNLCPACALFGTVEGEGLGSRVRFTDAQCVDFDREKQLIENVVFAELSSPRISYIPFYLRAKIENADYRKGYDSDDLEIRGRKFYWHHMPELNPQEPIEKNERNGTFDVLTPDTEFEFKVYFDGITEEQLKLLAAAIHLNENDIEGNLCQKIGHGKPLGYGSVKMTVHKCVLRTFHTSVGWSQDVQELVCNEPVYKCSKDTWEALKGICSFDACKAWENVKVEYPGIITDRISDFEKQKLNSNNWASHKWFTESYGVGARRPKQALAEITEENELAKYEMLPSGQQKFNGKKGKKTW